MTVALCGLVGVATDCLVFLIENSGQTLGSFVDRRAICVESTGDALTPDVNAAKQARSRMTLLIAIVL